MAKYNIIFLDTGPLYALIDKDDINHLKAVDFFKKSKNITVTSNYIIDELIT